jgi:transcription elongation factor GreA
MEMTHLVAERNRFENRKNFSNFSIGKGLLGKSVGEFAEITVPNGVLKLKF